MIRRALNSLKYTFSDARRVQIGNLILESLMSNIKSVCSEIRLSDTPIFGLPLSYFKLYKLAGLLIEIAAAAAEIAPVAELVPVPVAVPDELDVVAVADPVLPAA